MGPHLILHIIIKRLNSSDGREKIPRRPLHTSPDCSHISCFLWSPYGDEKIRGRFSLLLYIVSGTSSTGSQYNLVRFLQSFFFSACTVCVESDAHPLTMHCMFYNAVIIVQ